MAPDKAEDVSTARAAPHLHYLTVRMVSNSQVTIIKHHQVDFRQKQDLPFQNVQKYVAGHDQHLYDRQTDRQEMMNGIREHLIGMDAFSQTQNQP